MRRLLVGVGLLVASLALADAPVESAKVFVGAEGAKLTVLTLKPASDHKCVLQVSATGTDFDGKALPCTIEDNRGARYHITFHGRGWNVGVASGSGTGALTLYLPGNKELGVKYDEKASKELKTDDLYKAFKTQEASGAVAAFEKFDRPAEQASNDKAYAALLAATNKACGTTLTAKITWTGISDDVLKERSVGSYCGSTLEAMTRLCSYKAAREVFAAKLSTVSCTWAETKLEIAGKTLNVAVDERSSNLEERATEFFKQNL